VKRLLLCLLLALILFTRSGTLALADDIDLDDGPPPSIPGVIPTLTLDNGIVFPDLGRLSLSNLPPLSEGGVIRAGDFGIDPSQLPVDIDRAWNVGDRIENVLKITDFGSVATNTILDMSLSTIAGGLTDGLDLAAIKADAFKLLKTQSIDDLVTILPTLGGEYLGDVKPIFDLAKSALGVSQALALKDTPLSIVLSDNPVFGVADFANVDLSVYNLEDIPGIETVPLKDFKGSANSFFGDIPGLSELSMAFYAFNLAQGILGAIGMVDIVFGSDEDYIGNTITGSYKKGFNVPCEQERCAHLEMADALKIDGVSILEGKRWISGKDQQVEGGSGVLGSVAGGKEPTGRHPFGDVFKLVLTSTDEEKGTGKFSMYFRACVKLAFVDLGCTPYIIGPVPWPLEAKEEGIVIVGIDGLSATPAGGVGQIPGLLTEAEKQEWLRANAPRAAREVERVNGQEVVYQPSNSKCDIYKGIDLESFRQAIAKIETGGQALASDYNQVGCFICDGRPNRCGVKGTGNCGRALGRYQYMSYREDVRNTWNRTGGSEAMSILRRTYDDAIAKVEVSRAIARFFSPKEQEALARADWARGIDSLERNYRGDNIVYRLACRHYGRCGDNVNPTYASDALRYYRGLQKAKANAGLCTGDRPDVGIRSGQNFILPTRGVFTSDYGWRAGRMHNGVDIAAGLGEAVVAVADGVVVLIYDGCPSTPLGGCGAPTERGYGNIVLIRHPNGLHTFYAHLQRGSITVNPGDTVRQGQRIGGQADSGSSRGIHLHFEIRRGTKGAIDPKLHIPLRRSQLQQSV
jgi:murein DD-endopeptidase MepM/ murein hydrolase activator NlpD